MFWLPSRGRYPPLFIANNTAFLSISAALHSAFPPRLLSKPHAKGASSISALQSKNVTLKSHGCMGGESLPKSRKVI